MKNSLLLLGSLVFGFIAASPGAAFASGGGTVVSSPVGVLDQDLYGAFATVLELSGVPVADTPWPGYRLLDANGVMRVLSDVTGPASPAGQYSTSSQLMWSGFGNNAKEFRIQTRYADFGSTCDLNNPTFQDSNNASAPVANYGNGLTSPVYQSGHYSSCENNDHYSQNNFTPVPLITRAAWMYRACRKLGSSASSAQIALMVERIRVPDPTPTPASPYNSSALSGVTLYGDASAPDPSLTYNWCTRVTAPAESDYQALFRAFYPGRTIPQIIDPLRSQNITVSPSASTLKKTVSGTAALMSLHPGSAARAQVLVNPGSQTPRFKEKLTELVSLSDQYIGTLPSSGATGWPSLEDPCLPTPGAPNPNLEQVKAAAAWRALLITMCMDPGWQVL